MSDPDISIEDRIKRVERALIALANATQNWSGGSYDGAAYCSFNWRKEVMDAVKDLSPD